MVQVLASQKQIEAKYSQARQTSVSFSWQRSTVESQQTATMVVRGC